MESQLVIEHRAGTTCNQLHAASWPQFENMKICWTRALSSFGLHSTNKSKKSKRFNLCNTGLKHGCTFCIPLHNAFTLKCIIARFSPPFCYTILSNTKHCASELFPTLLSGNSFSYKSNLTIISMKGHAVVVLLFTLFLCNCWFTKLNSPPLFSAGVDDSKPEFFRF